EECAFKCFNDRRRQLRQSSITSLCQAIIDSILITRSTRGGRFEGKCLDRVSSGSQCSGRKCNRCSRVGSNVYSGNNGCNGSACTYAVSNLVSRNCFSSPVADCCYWCESCRTSDIRTDRQQLNISLELWSDVNVVDKNIISKVIPVFELNNDITASE